MQILDPSGYPMMSREEVKVINNLLRDRQCKRCLEWGSGNSTAWFPKENPFIERWYAVEHNDTYLELLEGKIDNIRTSIDIFVDKYSYINAPTFFGGKFDFILVDGEWRDECVDMAFEVIDKGGIILLHDCDREGSEEIMKKYADRVTILIRGESLLPNGFCAHRGLALFKT